MQLLDFETPVLTTEGELRFDADGSLLGSLYFPMVYLASDFPELTTAKKYLVLYSTDHSTDASGAIAWGDCNNLSLSDFTERGIVIQTGYQSETPALVRNTNDQNNEFIYLYFHNNDSDPVNSGYQQTKLYTTTGGNELHNCVFTDRGNVLGLVNAGVDEFHTGYINVFIQDNNSFVGIHHTQGFYGAGADQINRFGKSINSGNDYNWTRVTSRIDNWSFMPTGRVIHISPPQYFYIRGKQYLIGLNIAYDYSVDGRKICICECENNDYLPTKFLQNISSEFGGDNAKSVSFFIDDLNPTILHIYYTKTTGTVFSNPGKELLHSIWKLNNI